MTIGTFYYDFARNPPSFNFVDALLTAEEWRVDNKLDGLSVVTLPGPMDGFRRDNLPPKGKAERTRWRDNIVVPMPVLLPSCGAPAIVVEVGEQPPKNEGAFAGPSFGRGEYPIGFKKLVQHAKDNRYPFVVPQALVDVARLKWGNRYVTISERNTGWWIQRTTNLNEWRIVARELERAGYRVVLVPDGTKADRPVVGFDTDPKAACHVLERAALYAGAEMNFGIPSGPMWLCWFLGAPVTICKMINENEPPTSAKSYTSSGLPPGTQLANARPRQRILWGPEKASDLLEAFDMAMAA